MLNPRHLVLLLLALYFSGCYTQLYTHGLAERTLDKEDDYASYHRRAKATLLMDSVEREAYAKAFVEESLSRKRDFLQPKTVVIQKYYEDYGPYRGYSSWDWDYPFISFGIYSQRYRSYSNPYWWDDSRYERRYYSEPYHGYQGHREPNPATPHIFTPSPEYPELHKGHRSQRSEPSTPAVPKTGSESSTETNNSTTSTDSNESDHPKLEKGKRR